MWLIFKDTRDLGLSSYPGRLGWVPPHPLDSHTVELFWRSAGIFAYVSGWSPLFQPEFRRDRGKFIFQCLLECYCVSHLWPQGSRTQASCDSGPKRSCGLTMISSPRDEQRAYWALGRSRAHINPAAVLGGSGRKRRPGSLRSLYLSLYIILQRLGL